MRPRGSEASAMCHYCGCRQMPLIRDFIAEHERATDLGGDAVRAIDHGDLARARELLGQMAVELESHWRGEEDGIFRVMAREEQYAEYIEPLVREHRELAEFLVNLDLDDPADRQRVRDEVVALHEHISREEDGLFPASLIELSGADWDAAIDAWHEAHPGGSMRSG